MKHTVPIILVALIAVAFLVGRGCSDDSALEQKLEESARKVAEAEARVDSLEVVRERIADTLRSARAAIAKADEERERAQRTARSALDELNTFRQQYATLDSDAFALYADSVYRAGSIVH
jgi:outer membrane murein-binding lipoprotein Lpp